MGCPVAHRLVARRRPDEPVGLPDEFHPLFGSPMWEAADESRRAEMRQHSQAWQFSQFLHGEQGAMVCAAKIVEVVPDMDAKFYAATQTMDEARHVEAFSRFLQEKVDLVYPIDENLTALLEDTLRDSRWDMPYLGMQVLIEGLALAAFGTLRDLAAPDCWPSSCWPTSCRTKPGTSPSAGSR